MMACMASVVLVFEVESFQVHPRPLTKNGGATALAQQQRRQVSSHVASAESPARGFGAVVAEKTHEEESQALVSSSSLSAMSVLEIKKELLDLLPRMTGTHEEFSRVESYINELEAKYAPPQTLDFLNFAMGGAWQLLFSTNLRQGPRPNFRLKELVQRVEPNKLQGTVVNVAQWDLAEGDDGVFRSSGTFSAFCGYEINQGARMIMELKDHVLELLPGSAVPQDVQALVAFVHRAMPTELFDPNQHAMDTTYLDGDLRIVRMTGPSFDGYRDVFIRSGSMEINPLAK
jgi:PAP_fibrillin